MKKDRFPLMIIITAVFTICMAVLLLTRYYSDPLPMLGNSTAETHDNGTLVDGKININTASKEDFCMLPGIGVALADRIIAYREENGPFRQITDLTNIKGISQTMVNKISDYITVDN